MSSENPKSKSEAFGLYEEWDALGEVVAEAWIFPEVFLAGFLEDLFGNFSNG